MCGLQLMATCFRRLWNLGAGFAGGHLKVSCFEVLWDVACCGLSSHCLQEPQPSCLLCHVDWSFKPRAKASLSFLRNCFSLVRATGQLHCDLILWWLRMWVRRTCYSLTGLLIYLNLFFETPQIFL